MCYLPSDQGLVALFQIYTGPFIDSYFIIRLYHFPNDVCCGGGSIPQQL